MNQQQINQLENELWGSANALRANSKLTAAEYKDPVLGLILLRYAQNRYEQAKNAIEESGKLDGPRGRRTIRKEDFLAAGAMMLPEKAQYDHLANLPESEDISLAVNNAMKQIEEEYPDLAGVLPRNYQEMDADLLREMIRVFNKDSVKTLPGDIFGRIYEFFLMKFSMVGAGAQEGGEFFTPPSLVQLIVNLIEPDHGIIHDAACGSGGMFVQTGHFFEEHQDLLKGKGIKKYNEGKDIQAVQQTFDEVNDFIDNELTPEIDRATRENLTEESLALYDLLHSKKELSYKDEEKVKKVVIELLDTLKAEKLKIERWRESNQVIAQVKTVILDTLQHLPEVPYPNDDLEDLNPAVFQHIYSNYQGSGLSTYGVF